MQKEKLDAYHDQLVEMRARLREEFSHRVEHLVPGESEEGSISRAPFHKADRNEGRVDEELEIQSTEGRILDDVERAWNACEKAITAFASAADSPSVRNGSMLCHTPSSA